MAIPIDQLTKGLTKEEVQSSIYNLLSSMGFDVTSWQPGQPIRTVIAAVSTTYAGFSQLIASLTRSSFLDLAEGFWLGLLSHYVYNVDRVEATFATGQVTLNNTGGGDYTSPPFAVGDVIFLNPTINKTYYNTESFTLAPLETGKVVSIRAFEAGSASTSTPGTINTLVTELLGVTVTNATSVNGADAETDESLRERSRNALGALSPNGPQAAYEYQAKSTFRSDGSLIEVNRVKVTKDSSIGTVHVYLADSDGPLENTDVNLIDTKIQNSIVPIGIICIVDNVATITPTLQATVWARYSINITEQIIRDQIDVSLNNLFSNYPIGGLSLTEGGQGYLWKDEIEGAIKEANPAIFKVDLTMPANDDSIPLAFNEVAVYGGFGFGFLNINLVNT